MKQILPVALVVVGLFAPRAMAETMCDATKVTLVADAPLIRSGAVTKLDLSWFGLEGSAAGPSFFSLTMTNTTTTEQTIRVLVELQAKPTDPSIRDLCPSPCWLQREMTWPITIAPGATIVKTSRDLFSEQFESGGIEASSSPFKSLIGKLGFIPSSYLELGFRVLCGETKLRNLKGDPDFTVWTVAQTVIEATTPLGPEGSKTPFYQTVRTPDLLSPGAVPAEGYPAIPTTSPTFVFQSELANPIIVYPADEPKFTLDLWKVGDQESPAEAVERRPLATHSDNVGIIPFPTGWATLEPGAKYVWRVSARLRGPVQEPLFSELHTFTVSTRLSSGDAPGGYQRTHEEYRTETLDQIDRRIDAIQAMNASGRVLSPEERRLFRALFAILGDDPRIAVLMARDVVDLDNLRIDGQKVSLESVESVATEVQASRRRLTMVEFP